MTKTDAEQIADIGKRVGIKVRINQDGSVTYGNTKTWDASRAYFDLTSVRA